MVEGSEARGVGVGERDWSGPSPWLFLERGPVGSGGGVLCQSLTP